MECMEITLFWATKMNEIGMDLGHQFLLSIKTPLLDQLRVRSHIIIAALPVSSIESDDWLPYDLTNDQPLLKSIADSMLALGITDFSNEVLEDGIIDLAKATVNLSVTLYEFTLYSLKVTLPELYERLQDCLESMLRSHLTALAESLGLQEDRNIKSFLLQSMRFIYATVIPCLESWIEEETGRVALKLAEYRTVSEKQHNDLKEYSHLKVTRKRSSMYLKRPSTADDEI